MGVILIQIVIQLRDPEGPATHHCTRLAPHSAMILAELAEPTEPAEPGSREFWARLSQLHTSPWAWRWELAQPMHALSISSFVHHYLQHPSSTLTAGSSRCVVCATSGGASISRVPRKALQRG